MAKYKEELLAWEKSMIEAGRQDLVRVSSKPKKVKARKKAAKPKKKKAKKKKAAKKTVKAKKTTKKGATAKKSTKEKTKSPGKVKKSHPKEDKVDEDPSWMREE